MLGGATLVAAFGLIADRFGLELLGPYLLVIAVLLTAVFEVLERRPPVREAAR
jgi:fucose permease